MDISVTAPTKLETALDVIEGVVLRLGREHVLLVLLTGHNEDTVRSGSWSTLNGLHQLWLFFPTIRQMENPIPSSWVLIDDSDK